MNRLTKQQEYLLSRIPRWYDVDKKDDSPEPKEIISARNTIKRFEHSQSNKRKARQSEFQKAVHKATEAVYFEEPPKALKIIQALESKFGRRK